MTAPTLDAPRPRVLIVDDEVDNRVLLSIMLAWDGFVTQTADDGEQALLSVAADPPDVILVDISLGSENGFDLLRRLVESFPHLTGRIIMISTRAEEDYAELMEGTPAAGFLAKSELSVAAVRNLIPDLP